VVSITLGVEHPIKKPAAIEAGTASVYRFRFIMFCFIG